MTILKILQYPDSRLRRIASQVTNFSDSRVQQIIDDMLLTLHHTAGCAALAATQLEIDNPPSITVIAAIDGLVAQDLCLVNPQIIEKQGKKCEDEGCMSVYPQSVSAAVERATRIKVVAQDRNGKPLEMVVEGFLAKCIQHEVDHLRGVIYPDHLSALKRSMLKKKIAKLEG